MARNYPASTTMQKCLEERYKKEESAQFEWFFRDRAAGKAGPANTGASKQYEVFKRKIELAPRVDGLASRLPQAQQRSFHKKRCVFEFLEENLYCVEMSFLSFFFFLLGSAMRVTFSALRRRRNR